ncbi:hypothetical protein IC582_023323 [Cucumis melo]
MSFLQQLLKSWIQPKLFGLIESYQREWISSHVKPGPTDTDNKFCIACYLHYWQFAQRSRVRKLQYIAELERNVQALQANGSEVSAELEFLSQQNLILGMENKAPKQR